MQQVLSAAAAAAAARAARRRRQLLQPLAAGAIAGVVPPAQLLCSRAISTSSSSSTSTADSSQQQQGGRPRPQLPLTFPSVVVWGANTCVGKTLVSAGLVAAAIRAGVAVQYVKPVQTGYPADSDSRLVAAAAGVAGGSAEAARQLLRGTTTLFAYADPVSPHLAAAAEGRVVPDERIVSAVAAQLAHFTAALTADLLGPGVGSSSSSSHEQQQWLAGRGLSVIETAGGPASPGPSGSLQADLLRPLGVPALLVGDPNLGGISTTLSAYESLLLRGARVAAVVMMDDRQQQQAGGSSGLGNVAAVAQHLQHAAVHRLGQELPVLGLPLCQPPPRQNSGEEDAVGSSSTSSASSSSSQPGPIDAELAAWLSASAPAFDALLRLLQQQHMQQLAWLGSAGARAASSVWWPFTQHATLPASDVSVVDGRAGEDWLVYQQQAPVSPRHQATAQPATPAQQEALEAADARPGCLGPVLSPLHDAASSWWTQTAATPQQQIEVVRAAAAAAGRYMHVMWPQVVHAPGLALTEALTSGPLGGAWGGSRAFYSDDGSTAVEVALKMGLRKYAADAGLADEQLMMGLTAAGGGSGGDHGQVELQVLALANSYHGDTLGAMDCAGPSPFNGPRQTPWYRGRGCFLDPPTLALVGGVWRLRAPAWLQQQQGGGGGSSSSGSSGWDSWGSQAEALDVQARLSTPLAAVYRAHIEAAIAAHEAAGGGSSNNNNDSHAWAGGSSDDDDSSSMACSSSVGSTSSRGGGGAAYSPGAARRLAVLLMEPVLQGAGGMLLVDPLFQAVAVQVARARRMPVIFDEVFTGCWRLGLPTAGALLGPTCTPDIACYAKLLTGGVAPLAVTVATETVFEAFAGDSKLEALLHGHSYTAYPLGCAAAAASLALLQDGRLNPNLCTPAQPGRCPRPQGECREPCGRLLSLWDEAAAAQLSRHPRVAGVVVLGSVLAVELAAAAAPASSRGGAQRYGSAAAVDVVRWLRARGVAARPLGPVVYLMATPTSDRGTCAWLAGQLGEALDCAAGGGAGDGDEEGVIV